MLKKWTKFEKILLCVSIILVSFIGIIFKSDKLTIVSSIVGIITALLLAKGKMLGQVFGLLSALLYSAVSFINGFYGEVIVYMCVMFPMYIIGVISWLRNKNEKTDSVSVNIIKKMEWIISSIFIGFAFVGIYFLLKSFNTNELIVSSLSVIVSLFAIYLSIRRSEYSFHFYIVNDIVLIFLWGLPLFNGNIALMPIFLNPVINFVNDSYGVYNWRKMKNIQKNKRRKIKWNLEKIYFFQYHNMGIEVMA